MMDRLKKWLDKHFANVAAPVDAAPSVAPEPPMHSREWFLQRQAEAKQSMYEVRKIFPGATETAVAAFPMLPTVHPPRAPLTVEEVIHELASALGESKGWLRDYSDAVIRDAIDRNEPRAPLTDAEIAAIVLRSVYAGDASIPHRDAWAADFGVPFARAIEAAHGISAAAIGADGKRGKA
jgi:hypothetical protein